MHFQLHDSDILAKASFPFTRSTFRAKLCLKRIKQKVLYLHFKDERSFLLRNLRNAIWDCLLVCLRFISSREGIPAGTYQGRSSFWFEGFAPCEWPVEMLSPLLSKETLWPNGFWALSYLSHFQSSRIIWFRSWYLVHWLLFFHVLYAAPSSPFWDKEGGKK